jgi:hypothetical protein
MRPARSAPPPVEVTGNGFSLVNSILDGSGDTAIITGTVTGLDIGDNLITGYSIGIYVSGPTSTGSIHDNLFQGDGGGATGLGNGVNSETSHVTIDGNTFDGIYGGSLNLFPGRPDTVDLTTYVINNVITDSGAARPVQILPTNGTHNILGTDYNEAFDGETGGDLRSHRSVQLRRPRRRRPCLGRGRGRQPHRRLGRGRASWQCRQRQLHRRHRQRSARRRSRYRHRLLFGNAVDYTITYVLDGGGNVIGYSSVTDNKASDGDDGRRHADQHRETGLRRRSRTSRTPRSISTTPATIWSPTIRPSRRRSNAASDNYTIRVDAGTFNENLVIDKGVRILGAQADAAGRADAMRPAARARRPSSAMPASPRSTMSS